MTSKKYAEISRENFMADTAMPLLVDAFLKGKMNCAEMKALYAYHADCKFKHTVATMEILRQCGGDRTKAMMKIGMIIMDSKGNSSSLAEGWLHNHVNYATYEYIHDDFIENCGFKRPKGKK